MMREIGGKTQVAISQQAIDNVVTASSGDSRAALNCLHILSNLGTLTCPNKQLAEDVLSLFENDNVDGLFFLQLFSQPSLLSLT